MNRSLLLGILIFFAVVGISLLGDQPQAVAGHGCHGMVGYGCYGVPACGGCYGYGYAAPVYAHRPLFPSHRWHGCGGCYGYSSCFGCAGCYGIGGCYGCAGCYGYTTSYAVVDDCCDFAGTIVEDGVIQQGEVNKNSAESPTPAEEESEPGDDSLLPPKPPTATSDEAASAMLNLRVPEDAVVVINDYTTSSSGSARRYVSRGLEQGRKYRFEVRANVNRGGETVSQTKVVQLEATKVVDLVFDFDAPQVARVSN